jgi:predicted transcriptional regulator
LPESKNIVNGEIKLSAYQPNFNDARCRTTALRIIKWLETRVGAEANQHLQSNILRSPQAFGDSALGRYLRNYLLVKTNPAFQPGKFSQQYRIDQVRLDKLRLLVGLESRPLEFNRINCRFEQQQTALDTGVFEYNEQGGRAYNGLQNISKEIKQQEFALRGYDYDYDIECCAPTLFLQRAGQIKPNMRQLDYIDFYLTNKTQVRDELCIKYNLSGRQIKQVINGLFQGGVLNTYRDNKIFGYLNHNTYKMTAFKQDLFVKSLQADIKYMWKILRDDVKLTLKTNIKRLNGNYKSQYYKILEGQVMRPIWKYLKKNKVKHFREHDGFRSSEFVVPYDLEQIVKTSTGYQVKFVWTKIELIDSRVERGLHI